MKRLDLAATAAIAALALGFLVPVRAHSQDLKDTKQACANNVKQLALAAIQYADDKRFMPHVGKLKDLDNGGDSTPKGNDVPPRCLRSLIYFNYVDKPEIFICPASDDQAKGLSKEAAKDIRAFGWLGSSEDVKAAPIAKAGKEDKDADALTDLSYGWTLRGLTANSASTNRMIADRGARIGPRSKQKITGNHKEGWNVGYVDGHIELVKAGSDEAATLSATKDKKGALAVWDEANAGDKAEEKKGK